MQPNHIGCGTSCGGQHSGMRGDMGVVAPDDAVSQLWQNLEHETGFGEFAFQT